MEIRSITPQDYKAVRELIQEAFLTVTESQHNEAELVEKLRQQSGYLVEFEVVAEEDGEIKGYGLLSELSLKTPFEEKKVLGLAPLAVLPIQQNKGIGGEIIKLLEKRAMGAGYPAIFVLGDPAYYGRFGYQLASKFEIEAALDVPQEYYLVKELGRDKLAASAGKVYYPAVFNEE